MTAVVDQHTIFPPTAPEPRLSSVLEALHGDQAALIGPGGERVELPAEVFGVLRDVVEALSQGMAITIAPRNTLLTTQEAADLLGVSRPTLVKLLESGAIPFALRGRHRRVKLADVIAYEERMLATRQAALSELARESAADGSLEESSGFIRTR
ncbi:helix-turn-helix domain-containing protein [Actinokineospora bangkokensis]|uniref:Helix-turn-helix domain-containing protein n=1 Tax=Actinokineospora bangkokensis TaxID=1193682 RepID=A0A1Q9LGG2_9PSEU|nr:helix-turn-helix domain-containing protein [Actinokineospora bangkokensis]OLR91039.1 hypothetical protein BJP25_31355 [Actinokineospora bangkokensis]